MNKEICAICKKMMGNSLHTIYDIKLEKNVLAHIKCCKPINTQDTEKTEEKKNA